MSKPSEMTELKFRVWDNVDYMTRPFTLKELQGGDVQFTSDCKVMQFTGLYDTNYKEIYEGDIIDTAGFIRAVDFIDFLRNIQNAELRRTVVIGNIYQHPELLK